MPHTPHTPHTPQHDVSKQTLAGYPGMRGATPVGGRVLDHSDRDRPELDAAFKRRLDALEVDDTPSSDEALASASSSLHMRPLLADRYRLLRPLGAGGMSTVHLAEHVHIGKRVAIKIVADHLLDTPSLIERFMREARATAKVRHPNVIEISDFGETPSGAPFFVMDYLEGENLAQIMFKDGPMPWRRVMGLAQQIAHGIGAAHEQGVVHRDLKPDNCVRLSSTEGLDGKEGGEIVKVIDFGVAKLSGEGERLTKTGIVVGTPEYVAPEQAQGRAVDHRVDIYALGIIMYELLTGTVPFTGDNFMDVLSAQVYDRAPSFAERAPDLQAPAGVESIVRKAMQKQPEHRFQSMAEFIAAIEALSVGVELDPFQDDAAGRPALSGAMLFQGSPKTAGSSLWRALALGIAAFGLVTLGLGLGWQRYGRSADAQAGAETEARTEVRAGSGQDPNPRSSEGAAAELAPTDRSPAPVVDRITVRITTNVEARIVDALDGAVYGDTNDPEGFELERRGDVVRLRLEAPGYSNFDFQVVPTGDRSFSHDLVAQTHHRRGDKHKVKPQPNEQVEPKPDPEDSAEFDVHSEIKDPFAH